MSGFNIDWLNATNSHGSVDNTNTDNHPSKDRDAPSFQPASPHLYDNQYPSSVDNFLSPRLNDQSSTSYASAHTSSTTDLGSVHDSHKNYRSHLAPHADNRAQSNSVDSFMGLPSTGSLYSSNDDPAIPLLLTAQELTLQESKTYMRWYSDIIARLNSRTATMAHVLGFLSNFKISSQALDKIKNIFQKIHLSINIGEFFAILRLVGHALTGAEPSRRLIKVQAPVPVPPSILSKKRQNEDDDSGNEGQSNPQGTILQPEMTKKPLDLDSFTQFLLTGERPDEEPVRNRRSKKLKSVKFCDEVAVTEPVHIGPDLTDSLESTTIDYTLSMDQLLNRMKSKSAPQPPQYEPLEESPTEQLLRPNHTGPAQMQEYFNLGPQLLKPNMTGPARMADHYHNMDATERANLDLPPLQDTNASATATNPKISLQLFTEQMTGSTFSNTLQNSRATDQGVLLPPPVPNTRRTRSVSSPGLVPNSRSPEPFLQGHPNDSLQPSVNNRGPQLPHRDVYLSSVVAPSEIPWPSMKNPQSLDISTLGTTTTPQRKQAPPPPPSRRRVTSPNPTAPPLPPKVAMQQQQWTQPGYSQPTLSQEHDSTANLLDDLRALQEEVDRIGNMTGGF